VIGDYERVGVVARGAHSTIWKGFDPGLKREVALKQLSGSGAAEAARREAAALAGLRHPNILSVYDVLEDAEGVWLIEQWITGAPLSAVLAAAGKLRAIDALALIHGALQGLSYAHGCDVVHGDVAPANILIDQAGTPMLVDFGLAVTPGQLSLGGTPGYMAPEAAAGRPVDKRSDVYSSCVVLAELLKGARLFTTASSLALTREQAAAAPQLDGIEAPVAAVLATGLHPRPDDRPADAGVLLTELEDAIEETHGRRWLAGAGLGAIGSTAATVAAGTTLTGTASAGTTTAATASKTATSILSRGKVIGAGAAGAAVIAVAAFVLLRPAPPPPKIGQPPAPPSTVVPSAIALTSPYVRPQSPLMRCLVNMGSDPSDPTVYCENGAGWPQAPTDPPVGTGAAMHQDEAVVHASGAFNWQDGNIGSPEEEGKTDTTLSTGQTYKINGWTMLSSSDGTRFTNDATGHGMFISSDQTVNPF
jgi:serine/threonine protein kinase